MMARFVEYGIALAIHKPVMIVHRQEGTAMDKKTREYLRKIGAKGGKKSRRVLTKKQAQEMVKKRWEKHHDKQQKD